MQNQALGEEVELIDHRALIAGYITNAVTQQAIGKFPVKLAELGCELAIETRNI